MTTQDREMHKTVMNKGRANSSTHVSFRAQWSERSERNGVEEPRELTSGLDRGVPRLRSAANELSQYDTLWAPRFSLTPGFSQVVAAAGGLSRFNGFPGTGAWKP